MRRGGGVAVLLHLVGEGPQPDEDGLADVAEVAEQPPRRGLVGGRALDDHEAVALQLLEAAPETGASVADFRIGHRLDRRQAPARRPPARRKAGPPCKHGRASGREREWQYG